MITDRERRKAAERKFKKPVTKFEPIDLTTAPYVPPGMTRAWRNTRYTVMVFDNHPADINHHRITATRIMIQKHNNTPFVNHWSEIQKIKNEIFGAEVTAVEYYPAESELINDKNIYWIWIFPEGVLPLIK